MQAIAKRQVEVEQAQAEAALAVSTARAARGPIGPCLCLHSERVLLECNMSEQTTSTLRITNTGTAAVYFGWTSQQPKFPFPSVSQTEPSCFYLPSQVWQPFPVMTVSGESRVFSG